MPIGWRPEGTVYGTLLNFESEWRLWQSRMSEDPYKAAPVAPVLYIKSANTHGLAGTDLVLQDSVAEVEVGATLGLIFGPGGRVSGAALLNDWTLPHASYFRPPIKFRCRDGFLGLPAAPNMGCDVAHFATLEIAVRCNGNLVQTVALAGLRRSIPQLMADVHEFMAPRSGDILMVGCDVRPDGTRPRAKAGDLIEILAEGFAPVRHNVRIAS